MPALIDKLRGATADDVQIKELATGQAVVLARHFEPTVAAPEQKKEVVIYHMEHGNEGALVELVKTLSANVELWITGNDDAAGIGALGVAACVAAESPDYTVRSLLFEDHTLEKDEREGWVHMLRQKPYSLEQHMKISTAGELFVRRLVHGGLKLKDIEIPAVVGTPSGSGALSISAAFPPSVGPDEVEVRVAAIALEAFSENTPATFVGTVQGAGANVTDLSEGDKVYSSSRYHKSPTNLDCRSSCLQSVL